MLTQNYFTNEDAYSIFSLMEFLVIFFIFVLDSMSQTDTYLVDTQ
jgi:hypothetical protein